jgi:hypothetical protein
MMETTRALRRAGQPLAIVVLVGLLAIVLTGHATVALAVAAGAPLALALFHRPQLGVLALIALVPFHGVLAIANVPDWALAWKETLVVVTLVATFVCPRDARGPEARRTPGWLLAACGFVLVGVASAAFNPGVNAVTGLKIDFFYLLVPVILWRCPFSARDRDRLVTILMTTGFICAVIGLAQQVVGAAALNRLGYPYNDTIRFAGDFLRSFSTFDQPFPFALFEMVVLCIGIPVSLSQPTRLRNRVFLLLTPVYVVAMLSAFVRSAILGLAVALVYLGFRRYRVLLLGLPLALVALLTLGVLGGSLTGTFESGSSFTARSTGWEENVTQIASHPLGAGIGSSGAAAIKAHEFANTNNVYQPDNYYVTTVYELGILGLWMFVLLLIAAFRCTHNSAPRLRGDDRALTDGIAAHILAAAVAAFVANYFEIFPVDVLFWTLLGLSAVMIAGNELAPTASSEPSLDRSSAR